MSLTYINTLTYKSKQSPTTLQLGINLAEARKLPLIQG